MTSEEGELKRNALFLDRSKVVWLGVEGEDAQAHIKIINSVFSSRKV